MCCANWRNPFQFLNQTNPHLRTSYAEGAKRVKLVKNRVCQIKRQMVVFYRICQQNPLTFTFFWTPLSMHHACAYCYMVTQVPFEVISWCCHRRRTTHWKVFRKASTLWACINIKLNRIPFWKRHFCSTKTVLFDIGKFLRRRASLCRFIRFWREIEFDNSYPFHFKLMIQGF